MEMPIYPTWQDIAIRLFLTLIAGALLGLNRSSRGHPAGLRTTIIVGLAASMAMIQANILLPLSGKTSDSFAIMDLMRLPLGILTGVGFIGGGCILKRGELVTGVTTAASLWIITVIGLCFGGGQLALGGVGTIIAFITLWIFKRFDLLFPRPHRARVLIDAGKVLSASDLNARIEPLGYHARFRGLSDSENEKCIEFEVQWIKPERKSEPLDLLTLLEANYKIKSFVLMAERD